MLVFVSFKNILKKYLNNFSIHIVVVYMPEKIYAGDMVNFMQNPVHLIPFSLFNCLIQYII